MVIQVWASGKRRHAFQLLLYSCRQVQHPVVTTVCIPFLRSEPASSGFPQTKDQKLPRNIPGLQFRTGTAETSRLWTSRAEQLPDSASQPWSSHGAVQGDLWNLLPIILILWVLSLQKTLTSARIKMIFKCLWKRMLIANNFTQALPTNSQKSFYT